MALGDGKGECQSEPGVFLTVVLLDAIDRAPPAGVVGRIGRQPQAGAKRVANMGLERGDRRLFPPDAAEEFVIIRVEPCACIELHGPRGWYTPISGLNAQWFDPRLIRRSESY